MTLNASKYINQISRLLNAEARDIEPSEGDIALRRRSVIKSIDEQSRTITAIVSTPAIDRYDEIIEAEAFRKWLDVFMDNPVFLAGHRHVGFDAAKPTVIGHWTDLQITKEGLLGVVKFANTDLANDYWQLYRDGDMKAFSVGVIVHAWEMRDTEVGDKGVTKKLRVFTEVELIEISAVAVPANRGALVRAASLFSPTDDGAVLAEAKEVDTSGFADSVAKALEPHIDQSIAKHLDASPGGHLCMLIQDVVESMHGRRGLGDPASLDDVQRDPGDIDLGLLGGALKSMASDS